MENLVLLISGGRKLELKYSVHEDAILASCSRGKDIVYARLQKKGIEEFPDGGTGISVLSQGKSGRFLLTPTEQSAFLTWIAPIVQKDAETAEAESLAVSKANDSCSAKYIVAKMLHFYGIECDAVYVSASTGEKFNAPSHYPKVSGEYRLVPKKFLLAKQDEKRVEAEKRAARLAPFIEKAQALGKPVLVRTYPIDNQGCRYCHAHEACEYVRPDGTTFIVTGHAD